MTNSDSIIEKIDIKSILNLLSGKETLYALGLKNKLKKEDGLNEKEIHKIAEILSVITSDFEYYVWL